jgi:hypothetical protein
VISYFLLSGDIAQFGWGGGGECKYTRRAMNGYRDLEGREGRERKKEIVESDREARKDFQAILGNNYCDEKSMFSEGEGWGWEEYLVGWIGGDRHSGNEKKKIWYGGSVRSRVELSRDDTEPYTGMDELNHAPSHGRLADRQKKEIRSEPSLRERKKKQADKGDLVGYTPAVWDHTVLGMTLNSVVEGRNVAVIAE